MEEVNILRHMSQREWFAWEESGRDHVFCENFYMPPDSFIAMIDFLAPSVNASLPYALISNSGSDGPYPSITGGNAAAGPQPHCERL